MSPTPNRTTDTDTEVVSGELVDSDKAGLPALTGTGQDVATHDDAQILALVPEDDEWADVADGDLAPTPGRIPHLSLNRNSDGGFVDPETGEKTLSLEFVWLAKGRSRAWFRDPFGKGDTVPACRSFDGETADPNSPDLQNGGDCTTCPLAAWNATGDKPACRESIEALVFLPDPHAYGHLARIRWSGIAVRPTRAFWDSFQTRLPRRPPIAYVSRVTLQPAKTDFGEKLAPRFERVREIARKEAQPLIDERDRRLADWQADIADSVATSTADEIHDQPDTAASVHYAEGEEPF